MPVIVSPESDISLLVSKPNESITNIIIEFQINASIPTGSLRIGGDSPNGLVLVGSAPAARTVDIFDRETRVFVSSTISASDGTYAFTQLSDRTEGYDVIIRGNINIGERDVIVPGVHPV